MPPVCFKNCLISYTFDADLYTIIHVDLQTKNRRKVQEQKVVFIKFGN